MAEAVPKLRWNSLSCDHSPTSNTLQKYLDDLRKLQKYLDDLRKPGPNGKPYSGRYIGCLVGEIHWMLLVGGVYGNPDNKNSKNGNLRWLYECASMSYLVEQAGGKAIDGRRRILLPPFILNWPLSFGHEF